MLARKLLHNPLRFRLRALVERDRPRLIVFVIPIDLVLAFFDAPEHLGRTDFDKRRPKPELARRTKKVLNTPHIHRAAAHGVLLTTIHTYHNRAIDDDVRPHALKSRPHARRVSYVALLMPEPDDLKPRVHISHQLLPQEPACAGNKHFLHALMLANVSPRRA